MPPPALGRLRVPPLVPVSHGHRFSEANLVLGFGVLLVRTDVRLDLPLLPLLLEQSAEHVLNRRAASEFLLQPAPFDLVVQVFGERDGELLRSHTAVIPR